MLEGWSGESTTGRGPVEQEASSGRAGGSAWQLRRLLAVLGTSLGTWERVEYIYGFSIGEREGA
jgi:hypothetical protein